MPKNTSQSEIDNSKIPEGEEKSDNLTQSTEKTAPEEKGESETSSSEEQKKENNISYDKYRELLSETKVEREKRRELEQKLKSIEEKELQEQNRWKELYEKKENELKTIQQDAEREREAYKEAKKMAAFVDAIGGLKHSKYQSFVDTSKITMAKGEIEPATLSSYVDEFKQQFPELLKTRDPVQTPPSPAPKAGKKELSKMSFSELSEHLREMSKR